MADILSCVIKKTWIQKDTNPFPGLFGLENGRAFSFSSIF